MRTVPGDTGRVPQMAKRMRSGQRGNYSSARLEEMLSRSPYAEARSDPVFMEAMEAQARWQDYLATLREVEDNREFHPDPDPSPKTITGNRTWNVVRRPKWTVHKRSMLARNYFTNLPVGIQLPWGIKRQGMFPIVTCVRRAIRRQVLFAKKKTGKGARQRKRVWNRQSQTRC